MEKRQPKDLKNISFVTVEIELKSGGNLKTKGYLTGFQSLVDVDLELIKANEKFIWLSRKGSVHMYHTDYYYITEIMYGIGSNVTSITPYLNNTEAQIKAGALLDSLIAALNVRGWVKATKLVDYEKFQHVPTSIQAELDLNKAVSSHNRSGASNYSTGHQPPYSGASCDYRGVYTSQVHKEVNTSSMSRTTKYDVAKAVKQMTVKIHQIQEGIYKAPKLKSIPADDINRDMDTDNPGYNVYDADNFTEAGIFIH